MSRRSALIVLSIALLGLTPFALSYVTGQLRASACEDGSGLTAVEALADPPEGYAVSSLGGSRLADLRDALGRNPDVAVDRTTGAMATRGTSTVAVVLFTATDTADAPGLLKAYSEEEGFDERVAVGRDTGRARTDGGLTAVLGVASRCSLALVLSPDGAAARRVAASLATRPTAARG